MGVAARLSRYLQVLTQAKKMGKDRISSQEIADYTNINATQIRRDLSNFGKFGKRGVGYSIDGLLGEIRKILRTQGQHNIALVGAGRLGQAIAGSPIFGEHGITIAAVFDVDEKVVGRPIGAIEVSPYARLKDVVHDKNIVVGVLAVPASAAQQCADDLVDAGVRIIFNYTEALLDCPPDVTVHTSNPAVELLHALVLPPDLRSADPPLARVPARWNRVERLHRALAREWSLAGHDVTVVCQERRPGAVRPRQARGSCGPSCRAGFCRCSCSTATRGSSRGCCRTSPPAERDALRRGERRRAPRARPGRPRLHEPRPDGRRRRRAAWASRSASRRTAPSSSTRCAAGRSSSDGGGSALERAEAVYVGSAHIRARGRGGDRATSSASSRCRRGSTSRRSCPQERGEALADLLAEARADPPNPGNREERLPDEGNAARLEAFLEGDEPTVVYFGKLIGNKGVHVLLEALDGLDARAVIVGFGDFRAELERPRPRRGSSSPGPFEHRHLAHLLPLADAAVVPSIFPEAFGMVAAEAAACGCPPLVARHSGLAEVAEGLEEEYPPHLRPPGGVHDRRRRAISARSSPS